MSAGCYGFTGEPTRRKRLRRVSMWLPGDAPAPPSPNRRSASRPGSNSVAAGGRRLQLYLRASTATARSSICWGKPLARADLMAGKNIADRMPLVLNVISIVTLQVSSTG